MFENYLIFLMYHAYLAINRVFFCVSEELAKNLERLKLRDEGGTVEGSLDKILRALAVQGKGSQYTYSIIMLCRQNSNGLSILTGSVQGIGITIHILNYHAVSAE